MCLAGVSCIPQGMVVLGGESTADALRDHTSCSATWAGGLQQVEEWRGLCRQRSLEFIFERNWIEGEKLTSMC